MNDNNILYIGAAGTGKTHKAEQEAIEFVRNGQNLSDKEMKDRMKFVYLHSSYDNQSFISGISVTTTDSGQANYKTVDKVFKELCDKANNNPSKNYAIVLDDIQNVRISEVFGEAMSAIENRGEPVTLANGDTLTVPTLTVPKDNLKIIATMSTLKSKFGTDYAFLRRFNIHTLHSSKEELRSILQEQINKIYAKKVPKNKQEILDKYTKILNLYNEVYDFVKNNISDDLKGFIDQYYVGHCYFIPSKDAVNPYACVLHKIRHQVIPLLEQYVKDGILKCSIKDVQDLRDELCNTKYTTDYSQCLDISIDTKPLDLFKRPDDKFNLKTLQYITDEVKFELQKVGNKANHYKKYRVKYPTFLVAYLIENNLLTNFEISNNILFSKDILRRSIWLNNQWVESYFVSSNHESNYYNNSEYFVIGGDKYYRSNNIAKPETGVQMYQTASAEDNPADLPFVTYRIVDTFYSVYLNNIEEYIKTNPDDKANMEKLQEIVEYEYNSIHIFDNKKKNNGWLGKKFSDILDNIPKLTILNAKSSDRYKCDEDGNIIKGNDGRPISVKEGEKDENGNLIKSIEIKGVYKIMSTDYKQIMDSLGVHQMILQGPPGTSKTYGAKEFIKKMIGDEKLPDEKLEDYKLTAENYLPINNPKYKALDKSVYWDIVQFHPSYTYEDFVRGITVGTKGDHIEYQTVDKILGKMAKLASKYPKKDSDKDSDQNSGKEFYLVIDEINRANMATVFGELIYALEYRNKEVSTPYCTDEDRQVAKDENEQKNEQKKGYNIAIPDNLYIIGTMNTADKSISGMDYAIRRRFLFFPMLPSHETVEENAKKYLFDENNNQYDDKTVKNALTVKLFNAVADIFDESKPYLNSDYYKDDVQVGHTYFLVDKDYKDVKQLMKNRLNYQIIPILREYYKDGILENPPEKLEDAKEAAAYIFYCASNGYSQVEGKGFDMSVLLEKLEKEQETKKQKQNNQQVTNNE